jgi:hypothetical protein
MPEPALATLLFCRVVKLLGEGLERNQTQTKNQREAVGFLKEFGLLVRKADE